MMLSTPSRQYQSFQAIWDGITLQKGRVG